MENSQCMRIFCGLFLLLMSIKGGKAPKIIPWKLRTNVLKITCFTNELNAGKYSIDTNIPSLNQSYFFQENYQHLFSSSSWSVFKCYRCIGMKKPLLSTSKLNYKVLKNTYPEIKFNDGLYESMMLYFSKISILIIKVY